ncbi:MULTISPECIES: Kelch repeat-containing protein [unclassified Colwellia]|uniref:Kelch repeat-containing protein n=1 Tax=unclassified Colwellia TaxID=196834 RepID=UPI0015F6C8B0|nr:MULTISPECIES: kelch repeat-containing protein [unclassified Colwellia]MBA6233783.1 kelch repeat-containing protein [Colwellia sp. MB02u-7]MBA6237401.1 kelch repeat-containing protein [Colwellia sp. MB02u-11]MBA6257151.1 kelch repeat-containing protein [Colwellia sp. MB3u-28]MBA6258736.1 kelch repeat-containing protein [Colwellia sp. MB3u-41]MBA6300401.1 kelch repeat-containing protein [Colwellia sp. MB3u-22]
MINSKNISLSMTTFLLIILAGCSLKSDLNSESLSLSTARYGHAAVNDGSKIYVLAGANKSGFLSDIEIIEPLLGKKEILKNRLIPRRYFSAVWDGKHSIYILGGVSIEDKKFRYEKRVEVFNTITHEVSFAQPLPAPTRINSAVFLNGSVFVFGGGYPSKEQITASPIVAVLNIAQKKWVRAADMPTAKTTRAVVRDGLIYVVGGYDRTSSLDVFERFDPQLNKWESLPTMPEGISAHSLTIVKDKLFVFGNYNNLNSTYSYDFLTYEWELIDIGYKASRHNATTTLGDTTYVIGGNTGTKGSFLDYIQEFSL